MGGQLAVVPSLALEEFIAELPAGKNSHLVAEETVVTFPEG
jgi:hypothetical protein